MHLLMSVIFVAGILAIAMEDRLKINKAASALLTALLLWTTYILMAPGQIDSQGALSGYFNRFLAENPNLASLNLRQQITQFIVNGQIVNHLGDISGTLFFVMSTMVIIELIDTHGGFMLLTNRIHTDNKRRLLWIVAIVSFIISALIDNLATAIVVIAMLRKIIPHRRERWIYSSMVVIAANAGGSWSPIGDVTTILLWNSGNITPLHQITHLLLPSFVCMATSVFIISRFFKKDDHWHHISEKMRRDQELRNVEMITPAPQITVRSRVTILAIGILSLVMVPVFNYVTGLPPFMGVLTGMVVLWVYTDLMYGYQWHVKEKLQYSVVRVFSRIDMATILFFLGILLSVAALQSSGQLSLVSGALNKAGNPLSISFMIGLMSSVLDNVALVAATMGMYPISEIGAMAPGVAHYFVADGQFWTFLAYCAVTGGSILIIGSATGVTIMGLEKISFTYYLKRFSLIALTGYVAGAATYLLISAIF